jgi:hypothetical protein
MPFNGAGSYSPPGADFPAVANTLIESAHFNNVINDIATALSTCITKDGQTTVTANIPFGGFRLTNFGAGVARSDGANLGQLQDGTANWVVAGGTADALTATYSPAITALIDGQICFVRATAANATTTPTFAPNGLTARTITRTGGVALSAGDIPAALAEVILRYNLANTRWELLNPATIAVTTLSPAQITANQNDYSPATLAAATQLRINSDATRNITGMATGSAGRPLTVVNSGTFAIVFKYEDAGSSAANRFSFACTLGGGQSMKIEYDGTTTRWRAIALPEPLGTTKDFIGSLPEGFLAIDQNVSRTTYASLFNYPGVGTTFGIGDGSTTFGLFLGGGAMLMAAGAGTQFENFANADIDTAADTITVPSNSRKWITGKVVVFTLSSGTITGLSSGNTYYIIRNSTTTVKLASTLANAQNGVPIDMTAKSSPIGAITYTSETRTLGERLGEQEHAMSITELVSHSHGASIAGGGIIPSSAGSFSTPTTTAGGNAAMNVTPDSTVVTRGIRYC